MAAATVALGDGRRSRLSAWLAFWIGVAAPVAAKVLGAVATIASCSGPERGVLSRRAVWAGRPQVVLKCRSLPATIGRTSPFGGDRVTPSCPEVQVGEEGELEPGGAGDGHHQQLGDSGACRSRLTSGVDIKIIGGFSLDLS